MALIYVYLSYLIVKIHINGDCTKVKKCVPLQRISENALRVKACTFYIHKLMN
jgi:hypothetical protein